MECQQCHGPTYDNRDSNKKRVADGQKPMPEFVCKDRDGCGWKQWPPRPAGQGSGGGGWKGRPPQAPKWTWVQLSDMYHKSLLIAAQRVSKTLPAALPADILAATATLFIAATRDGIKAEESNAPVS